MHLITPYNPWTPRKPKTWQEESWEQQQIAEIEAKILAEASSKTLPENAPDISVATAGRTVNAMAGAGGAPPVQYYHPRDNTISFTSDVTTNSAPLVVQFTNQSSQDAAQFDTWLWNFGDGTTSTGKNPSHTFSDTGSYTIQLTGSSPMGVKSYTSSIDYISASLPTLPATVEFTPLKTSGSAPLTVTFTNTTPNYSSNYANTYKWIFSGSNAVVLPLTTSTETNPTITFNPAGKWYAKLEMTGSWGIKNSTGYLYVVTASV